MTNEELAVKIQNGELSLMESLWGNVERMVAWYANRIMHILQGLGGVEIGDLINSGYIALDHAVKTYEVDKSSFSTWFMYFLRREFAIAAGYRTKRPLRGRH